MCDVEVIEDKTINGNEVPSCDNDIEKCDEDVLLDRRVNIQFENIQFSVFTCDFHSLKIGKFMFLN